MSIFDKLKDKAENIISEIKDKTEDVVSEIKYKTEDVVSDCVWYLGDKADEALDLADRRMQRRFKKLEEKEEAFNALFGLEEYKNTSIKKRAKVVFAKKEPVIKTIVEYGDVIGVNRGVYQHFGIYVGDNRVIHYSGSHVDFNLSDYKNISIREDSLDRFLHNNSEYFVFDCEADKNKSLFSKNLLIAYTPEETVQRAKSKLGENKYSLPFNNCEHFAIWCKTGIHKSTQVDKIIKQLVKMPITVVVTKIP